MAIEAEFTADNKLEVMVYSGDMGFDYPGERAFIGDSDGAVVEVTGAFDQFVRVRGTAKEGEITDAVEFGVGHDGVEILYG